MFFLLFLLYDRRIWIRLWLIDPDPWGPKTYGSYGSGSGSATLLKTVKSRPGLWRRWCCPKSTTCSLWPLCTLQVACDEGDAVREVPGIRLLWVQPLVLSDPMYSPGRLWRRWRCLRSTWYPSSLSRTICTLWPLCTMQVAGDEGDAVREVPGIRLFWVQPLVLSDPSVLCRSPVTKVTLSEKYLVSVCSEYNHVRTWSVTRFRGMISTQPGSTPLASFKIG
jgi:hypothetical protein